MSFFSKLFGGKDETAESFFEKGLTEYRKGDYKQAVDTLTKAIDLAKATDTINKQLLSNIHNIRGEVYLSVGVAILSQSDFVYALDYNPENESALNNLGIWFTIEMFSNPDYKKSLEYFDKAVAIRPDRKDIILNRAIAKIKSGDTTGCEDLKKLDAEGYPDAKIGLEQYCAK